MVHMLKPRTSPNYTVVQIYGEPPFSWWEGIFLVCCWGFFFLVNPNIKIIRNGNEEVELPLTDSVEHLLLSLHAM